jgi:hypothetical protein
MAASIENADLVVIGAGELLSMLCFWQPHISSSPLSYRDPFH